MVFATIPLVCRGERQISFSKVLWSAVWESGIWLLFTFAQPECCVRPTATMLEADSVRKCPSVSS